MDNLDKLREANRKADQAVDPWMQRVNDSPYTVVIIGVAVIFLGGLGVWLAW